MLQAEEMTVAAAICFVAVAQAFLKVSEAQVAGLFGLTNQGDVSRLPDQLLQVQCSEGSYSRA